MIPFWLGVSLSPCYRGRNRGTERLIFLEAASPCTPLLQGLLIVRRATNTPNMLGAPESLPTSAPGFEPLGLSSLEPPGAHPNPPWECLFCADYGGVRSECPPWGTLGRPSLGCPSSESALWAIETGGRCQGKRPLRLGMIREVLEE